jgi:organic radical activating enzyme
MNTLRLSELYISTQGEGTRVGELTAFVRFAGCNKHAVPWLAL